MMFGKWLLALVLLTQAAPDRAEPGTGDERSAAAPAAIAPGVDGLDFALSGSEVSVGVTEDGTIIMEGTEEDLAALSRIIEMLDQEAPRKAPRIFRPKNAQASALAPTLQSILDKMKPAQPRPEHEATILADARSNLLIVVAATELMDQVEMLIEQMDVPTIGETDFTPLPLKFMKAADAAAKIKTLLEEQQRVRGDAGPLQVNIVPDDRTNSILVQAPPSDLEQVRKLLEFIDVEPNPRAVAKMVFVPLLRTKANEMSKVLDDLIKLESGEGAQLKAEIRRLRLLKAEESGKLEELPEIDLEQPIRILADDEANAILIGTVESNIEPFLELVRLLDAPPIADEMSMRLFPLRHADAQKAKEVLNEIFTQGKNLPEQPGKSGGGAVPDGVTGKALVYNIAVIADTRTNTLIVSGRLEQVLLAQELVNNIDVPEMSTRYAFEIVKLEYAGVARVAEVLQEVIDKRKEALEKLQVGPAALERERVIIIPEPRSGSLLIAASPENFEELRSLALQLDSVGERLVDDIRILTLDKTTASDLKEKITELWERRKTLLEDSADAKDMPVVVADPRSNALIIASSKEDFESIKLLVERLEAQPLSPLAEIRLLPLQFNDASELGQTLKELFEERMKMRLTEGQKETPADRIAIVPDVATNTLLIAASNDNYRTIVDLVSKIDVEFDIEGLVRMFAIKNTDASRIAETIKELFSQGIVKPVSEKAGGEIRKALEEVAMVSDARSNTIIVSASKQNFQIIEGLIAQMDSLDPPAFFGNMQIFQLEHADAAKLASMLEQLFEGIKNNSPDQNVFVEPTVLSDERSNTIVVSGSNDAIAHAEDMIRKLDLPPSGPTSVIEVYPLLHASGTKLAPMIADIFENKRPPAQGDQRAETPVYIIADESSNSLIVTASRNDHVIVTDLLKLLDVPSTVEKLVRIFPLKQSNAEDLSERLSELFQERQGAAGGGGGGGGAGGGARSGTSRTELSIQPDLRTNSLIVRAGPTDMENIAMIIERLDTSEPTVELMIKAIRLTQSDAEAMAETLTEALESGAVTGGGGAGGGGSSGGAGRGAGSGRAVIMSYFDEQQNLRKLLRQNLTIVPDTRTNSLLVIAPPESVEMLEGLVRQLDSMRPETSKVRVFPLRNANAEDMITTMEKLFESSGARSSGGGGGGGADDEGVRQLVFGGEGAAGGRQTLSFTADKRTNSVIAAGTDQYLDIAESLLRQLDARDIQARVAKVYAIRHGTAESLAEALKSLIDEQTDRFDRLGDQAALQRQIEREVTVVPFTDTNSLLLDYDPRRESEILDLVNELDRQPPQVMIQVLLAEVSLDERLEMGIEFAGQDLLYTETGNDFDFVAGTDVGAVGGSSLAGFSFTITGEDFNFLLRMLQTEGTLEVLSRPQILVQDNQEANISIADDVPFVSGITVTDAGNTQSQVQYREVGIILDVKPHINPDGFVTLEIAPEISNFTNSSITITEGVTAPIFNRRSAETIVTVRDGETVLIGGLIQTREESTESKVPVAGDIPGLGVLFRSQTRQRRKSELMIVLTPRVVRAPEDLRRLNLESRDRDGIVPDEVLRSPLFQGMQLKPGEQRLHWDLEGELEQWPELEEDEREPGADYAPRPDVYGPGRPQAMLTVPDMKDDPDNARLAEFDNYNVVLPVARR